jgi:hypothetical protein
MAKLPLQRSRSYRIYFRDSVSPGFEVDLGSDGRLAIWRHCSGAIHQFVHRSVGPGGPARLYRAAGRDTRWG